MPVFHGTLFRSLPKLAQTCKNGGLPKGLKPLEFRRFWSDQRDLNPRPLDPQSSALPNCAMVRTVQKHRERNLAYFFHLFNHRVVPPSEGSI